jgi:hypothetical protein
MNGSYIASTMPGIEGPFLDQPNAFLMAYVGSL